MGTDISRCTLYWSMYWIRDRNEQCLQAKVSLRVQEMSVKLKTRENGFCWWFLPSAGWCYWPSLAQSLLMCPLCCIIHTNQSLCKKNNVYDILFPCFFDLRAGVTVEQQITKQQETKVGLYLFLQCLMETWEQTEMMPGSQRDWFPSQASFPGRFGAWWQTQVQKRRSTS